MVLDWICVPRSSTLYKKHLIVASTIDHPLKINFHSQSEDNDSRASCSGSISCPSTYLLDDSFINLDGTDPLSQFAVRSNQIGNMESADNLTTDCKDENDMESKHSEASWSWESFRLEMFAMPEKITGSNFLNTAIDNKYGAYTASSKIIDRLSDVDNFDDDNIHEILNLTQIEYVQLIKQLNNELIQSWRNDQRVKALKTAIKCIKTLGYPSDLGFYPSQFILITDILDMFGKLVYDRLKQKSLSGNEFYFTPYSEDTTCNTCLNWFFKIASIRELLPRIYMEICLLRCYEFIKNSSFTNILQRLSEMIRGITHPLVAIYTRCYLVRVGIIIHHDSLHIYRNFQEIVRFYPTIFLDSVKKKIHNISIQNYLSAYKPALNFILNALANKYRNYTVTAFKDVVNVKNNALLLASTLQVLQSEFICTNAMDILNFIKNVNSMDEHNRSHLLCVFGYKMSTFSKLCEDPSLILKSVFQLVNELNDAGEYLNCVEAWVNFLANTNTISEINNLLGEIVQRLDCVRLLEKQYQQLKTILFKIFTIQQTHMEFLLLQENFLPYLDLFRKDTFKIAACKFILTLFKQNSQGDMVDANAINTLLHLSRILSDSITVVSVAEEKALIAELICSFIRKVNFGHDMERQLIFYVEVRNTFANFDAVYCTLIYAVSKLATVVYSNTKGKHTRKSHSFVKACVAFNYVTIPCITCKLQQMNLYALNGEVALVNLCYGQAEANFEMALRVIHQLPRSIERNGMQCNLDSYVMCFIRKMLATLILVPDNPDKGVLHLFRLLLESIEKCFIFESDYCVIILYLHCLDMLYHQSFEDFPFQISGVVLNDALYGHDPKFTDEVNNLCEYVIQQILKHLPQVGISQELPIQAQLASELLWRILRYADLEQEKIYVLATNLWCVIVSQENSLESNFKSNIINTIKDLQKDGEERRGLRNLLDHLRKT